MAATSITVHLSVSHYINDARNHLGNLGSETHAAAAITSAFQACDGIKDLIVQQESIEQLNILVLESIKAGLDISSYLFYYIKWIEQFEDTNDLPKYIGYATDVYSALSEDIRKKRKPVV